MQNDKLVGAVTHVFVNDPTREHGIFIENMFSEAEKSNKRRSLSSMRVSVLYFDGDSTVCFENHLGK